ncbi:DedA family protein [Bosea sp. BIWAKO-01]|uniref:DedA family protein n=1 Tax=Bosea sp. BIWAKO-01 TaxID=506668 RepID=UPI000852D953|nr:DedA family protein [Bosea sp. BIWAKO-01]GAU86506.1 DedA protein [Bosea sp. BIWAKO-01]
MEHLFSAVEPYIREYGAVAIFVILFLESLGALLPGESALIFAGVLASRGELSLSAVLFNAWVGAVLGDNVGYLIGRTFGRAVILKHGSRIGLTPERFNRVEAVFARYGPATVAGARFVNILRQLNGIAAGTTGMDWRRFLLFNALGGALWVAVWGAGAFYFGTHISGIAAYIPRWGHVGIRVLPLVLAAIGAIVLLVSLWRSRKQQGSPH